MGKKDGLSLDQLSFMIKAMEESGYITKEEAKDLLYETATKDYEDVMRRFKMKYNFRPRLVAD
jgi:predicted transcriptional regulator